MIIYYDDFIKGKSIKNGEEKSFVADLSDILGINVSRYSFYSKQFSYLYSYQFSEEEGKKLF